MPTRQEWLLFLIAGAGPGDPWLDRLQLLEGVHTLQEEMSLPELDYAFTQGPFGDGVPFAWGLYHDISCLEEKGLIYEHRDAVSYGATSAGRALVASVAIPESTRREVQELRERLGSHEVITSMVGMAPTGSRA